MRDRITELVSALARHQRLYAAGHPEISDAAYDRLEDELRALDPDHPVLARVGGELAADLPKVAHDVPMLSLQKTYDQAELQAWMDGEPTVGTVKVDGVSMSLVYEGGRFTLAKTRGDGQVGEDVTAKVRWVADVPPRLLGSDIPERLEIRGELYCTEDRFVQLAATMSELGLQQPTSQRNIVAGLLGRKNHIDLARYFSFFAFGVADPRPLGLATESEQFAWLGQQGFRLPWPESITDASGLLAYLERVRELMEEDEVPIDGAVFSYERFDRQRALGATAHHPRFKMSFKWQGQTAIATIREVVWATSRLGVVTPVASIAPVALSGATISNVTLHNAAHVRAFNLKTGDEVEIVRSGEVIPKFLQVMRASPGAYQWPETCPACDADLVFDEVRLRCPATGRCPAQRLGQILAWIRAVGIDDLSEKRLVALMDAGKLRGVADLYRLSVEDFFAVPLIKEKMATKLVRHISAAKRPALAQFLNGLGIEGAGVTTWERLISEFPSLEGLQAAPVEAVAAVPGFAAKSAQQIVAGLAERAELIGELKAVGVVPAPVAQRTAGGALAGKTLVITGTLSRPRAEVEQAIKDAGGRISGSVSKATHAVVTDDPESASSKMTKARALGVPVWSEAELQRQLAAGGDS